MEEGDLKAPKQQKDLGFFSSPEVVHTIQKVIAEVIGTYFLIFAGCCVVVLNKVGESKGTITFPGIAVTWGLSVMILVYSLGHISGAHFNPAVTISFAVYRQFPLKQIGELAGIAVGMTIIIDVFVAGPISGASMNPARSIGPALVMHVYSGLWVYIVGPFVGTFLGSSAYNLIRFTDKPLNELSGSSSFLNSLSR
ncbi:hypothetical protein RYX36_036421 [Vicia faba]